MRILLWLILIGLITNVAFTKQKPEPQLKLVQFHLALLKKGSKWTAASTQETASLHQQHITYVTSLLESGKAMIAGPMTDDGEIRGVYIFRAQSAEEAKAWAEGDPAVAAGHLVAEMHPWWSEDVMKKPASPIKLETAYLGFLTRGALLLARRVGRDGERALAVAREKGWEGIIAKDEGSIYEPGARSRAWLKVKVRHEGRFLIGGIVDNQGDFSVLVGERVGGELLYRGTVECGFTVWTVTDLLVRSKRP